MASGFVSRWKGKIKASVAYIDTAYITNFGTANRTLYGSAATQTLTLVSSSLGASTVSASIALLLSSGSTTTAIVRLSPPQFAGQPVLIQMSTLGLGGLGFMITASTAGAVTFNGSSDTVVASTIASTNYTLDLRATSTTNWAILGAYPDIYTSTGGTIWALSTST